MHEQVAETAPPSCKCTLLQQQHARHADQFRGLKFSMLSTPSCYQPSGLTLTHACAGPTSSETRAAPGRRAWSAGDRNAMRCATRCGKRKCQRVCTRSLATGYGNPGPFPMHTSMLVSVCGAGTVPRHME